MKILDEKKELEFYRGLKKESTDLERGQKFVTDGIPKNDFLYISGGLTRIVQFYSISGLIKIYDNNDYSEFSQAYIYKTLACRIQNREMKNKGSPYCQVSIFSAISYLLDQKQDFDFYFKYYIDNLKNPLAMCLDDMGKIYPFTTFLLHLYCKINSIQIPKELINYPPFGIYKDVFKDWDNLHTNQSLLVQILDFHQLHSGNGPDIGFADFTWYAASMYPLNYLVIEKALKAEGKSVNRPDYFSLKSKLVDFPLHFKYPDRLPEDILICLKMAVKKYGKGFAPTLEEKYLWF